MGRLAVVRVARIALAIPLAFLSVALMALAVMLAEGREEVRRWWATQ